jgi:glutathione S-transferase
MKTQKASMVNSRSSDLTPNEQGRPYTSPAVKFDSSTYIQDSAKIALELEKRYPEPSLHLDSSLLPKAYAAVSAILEVSRPMLMRKVVPNLLNERSADYISHTRAEALRRSREEYVKESVVEEVWRKLEMPLKNMGALSRGNEGPFVMGKTRKFFFLLMAILKKETFERKGGKS